MKKDRTIPTFLSCVLAMILLLPLSMQSAAMADDVSSEPEGSDLCRLTIRYFASGVGVSGCEARLTPIAEEGQDGRLHALPGFESLETRLNRVTRRADWDRLLTDCREIIQDRGIQSAKTLKTNAEGTVSFTDLKPGVYLVDGITKALGESTVEFSPFLAVVPERARSGTLRDVVATPKGSILTPVPTPTPAPTPTPILYYYYPRTGDDSPILLSLMLLAVSTMGLIVMSASMLKQRKADKNAEKGSKQV